MKDETSPSSRVAYSRRLLIKYQFGFWLNLFIRCISSSDRFQIWMAWHDMAQHRTGQHSTRFQSIHRVIQQQQQEELNQTLVEVSNGKSFIRNDEGKGRAGQRQGPPSRSSARDLVRAHPWCISFDSEQVSLLPPLLLLCCTRNSAERCVVTSQQWDWEIIWLITRWTQHVTVKRRRREEEEDGERPPRVRSFNPFSLLQEFNFKPHIQLDSPAVSLSLSLAVWIAVIFASLLGIGEKMD